MEERSQMLIKAIACFIVFAMIIPIFASMPAQAIEETSPLTGSELIALGRTGLLPPEIAGESPPHEQPQWTSGGLVYLIVQDSLYAVIPDSIDMLKYDIENRRNADYNVEIKSGIWNTHTQVKATLQSGYSVGMVGAILIGNIPTPWYRLLNPPEWGADYWETFPIDLYYMDLDGTWGSGGGGSVSDPFNTHTAGTGDLEPEIWVSRLYTDSLPDLGSESVIIEDYIDRNNEYSWGNTAREDRALVYVDDDWYDYADEWSGNVGLVYPDRTTVKELAQTIKTDYMPRLSQNYEWLSLFAHTGIYYHALKNGAGWDYIYNYEIESAGCQALFYNLYCCGAADYATEGYIQGYYAFAGSGLLALGSAKTGSMLEFQDFYQPVSEGACIGEAFKDWLTVYQELWGDESRAWFYGMNIAGDPTLETGGYNFEPPEPPTALTVEHWGPSSSQTVETRYMRYDSALGTAQTATPANYLSGTSNTVYTGFRAWKKSSGGTETEITGGAATAVVTRTGSGEGIQTATFSCPQTALLPTDSVVIRIYQSLGINPPTDLAATFTTEQLGAIQLDAATWAMNYYTRRAVTANDRFYWGTSQYNSRIEGFAWSVEGNPTDHNTLNWTASVSPDVEHYNVYRSEFQTGPFGFIGTSPAGTNYYVDMSKGAADSTAWWYIVRAEDTAANEEQNADAVQEPAGAPYSIMLTAKPTGSWAFVSYPIATTGHIETVLNDTTLGDGGTDWDVAKTWDNQQKKWLTYRKGSPMNTFTDLDNTMGLWLHLTSNGADQALTLGTTGSYPGTVVINLYTGWNLVGYPSAIPWLGSLTLPAQADKISVWQAATPYVTDSIPGSVTMSHGNAYWVHVTSDCTWTIMP